MGTMHDGDDPADHTATEVTTHLATADATEVQRVLELEQQGKQRVTILRAADSPDADAPTVTVTLRHHWTDASGQSYAPGAELEVAQQVAEHLVNGRYATSDQVTPDPVPVSSTDTGMVSTDAAATAGVTNANAGATPTI